MRKLVALLLAVTLLGGWICSEAAEAEIFSWDFTLRFRLNTDGFSFREKEHLQGYADLLDALELRGNYSWCPETNSLELSGELTPVTNPSAGISFRIFGFPDLLQLSSSVFGDETVWFIPSRFMYFAQRAWEALLLPLPYLALLIPSTTINAFQGMADAWNKEAGPMNESHSIPVESVERIAEAWRQELDENFVLQTWVSALTNFLPESEPVESALKQLPDLLLAVSAGEGFVIEVEENGADERSLKCLNADGITVFEEHSAAQDYRCVLALPENGAEYMPSLSFRRTGEDGMISLALQAAWNRSPDAPVQEREYETGYSRPDSILQVQVETDGFPVNWPSDAVLSGKVFVDGYLLPNFHFFLDGSASADGDVALSVTPEDQADAGPVFACFGTVLPVVREELLAFTEEELKTGYNLTGLDDKSLHRLVNSILRPFVSGMIDFLYEIPASSCQSIMDALEEYGILQTLLK